MSAIEEIMLRLEASQGDGRAQPLIIADIAIDVQPEMSRDRIRAALDAAAVLHWFDVHLLGHMLEVDAADARERFEALARLPFVERTLSRKEDAWNVHEATRLGWRRRLAADKPETWHALSARAATWFAQDGSPPGRIEWIYHLLSADPGGGAISLQELQRAWLTTGLPQERQALASALGELEESGVAHVPSRPAKLFICYSSEDHRWRRSLQTTLTILQDRGVITFWFDRMVSAGEDWNDEIQKKLEGAEIVIFLISRYFLASHYINRKELPKALALHKAGKVRLIPLILTACSWDRTPLWTLQTATGDRRPLREWKDKEAAYYRIETELENVWQTLRGRTRDDS